MQTKEYVKLWLSYKSYFEPYSAAEVGRLVLAMMEYRASGAEPEFSGSERFVWPAIKRDIDESVEALQALSETLSENGKRGGRPRKQDEKAIGFEESNCFSENQTVFEKSKKSQGLRTRTKDKDKGQGQGDMAPARHKHGPYENVLLSEKDLEALKTEFPADWQKRIDRLSEYIASTGKSYKNHLATIRSWARSDGTAQGGKPSGGPSYREDADQIEKYAALIRR